jgi:prepilin-type N-terminal cleavage/methylation domain-containing protein
MGGFGALGSGDSGKFFWFICDKIWVRFMQNRGFTLLELLVVIAMIGIFVSVVLGAYGSSSQTSRINAGKVAITGLLTDLTACYGGGGIINITSPGSTVDICKLSMGVTWPKLPAGWVYPSGFGGKLADVSYVYGATNADDSVYIVCQKNMATVSGVGVGVGTGERPDGCFLCAGTVGANNYYTSGIPLNIAISCQQIN